MDLRPGDVLSYSSGSTQTGPDGYRKLVPGRRTMLEAAAQRWPELLDFLGRRPAFFVNAYPAAIGTFQPGITVDTYLSPRVFSRALQLARQGEHAVILLAQPLFLAELVLHHVAGGWPFPGRLMVWCGGYVMPRSLECALEEWLAPHVERLVLVQYFGAAEVDAGCLMARQRTPEGELIYHPRDDVEPDLDGDELLLSLRSRDGHLLVERFKTGDLAPPHGADGWVIGNPRRLHPEVEARLESWDEQDWRRRTGYVRREDDRIRIQLRQGVAPQHDDEIEHFDFARRFSFTWLAKPDWR